MLQTDLILAKSGKNREEVVKIARRAFAIYEGYMVLYRIKKDVQILKDIETELLDLV